MRTQVTLAVVSILFGAAPAFAGVDGNIAIYRMNVAYNGSVGDAVFPSCGSLFTPIYFGIASKAAFGVFAELSGTTAAGISGAELYISGLESVPAGWTKTVTYAPGTVVLGRIDEPALVSGEMVRRGNITWQVSGPGDPNCQTATRVLVAVVEIQSPFGDATFPVNHWLTIGAGNPPSNPALACPVLRLCDAPVFTGVCVSAGRFVLNPATGGIGSPGVVGDPFPAAGATDVPRDVQLSWTWFPGDDCTPTAWMAILDFGTDPENLGRNYEPPWCGDLRKCFSPPLLAPHTTYYWRAGGGYVTSPLWSFTTGDVIAVNKTTWGMVKQFYR